MPSKATWTQFLFSPAGRFNRARYWGSTFLLYGVAFVYFLPALVSAVASYDTNSVLVDAYIVVGVVLSVAIVVAHIVTTVKRFHDRDKSWPWFLVSFIPYIGALWIFIECGCLPGTRGRNRFGPDPLNPDGDDIVDVFAGTPGVPGPVAAEPRLAPDFGVTARDRLP